MGVQRRQGCVVNKSLAICECLPVSSVNNQSATVPFEALVLISFGGRSCSLLPPEGCRAGRREAIWVARQREQNLLWPGEIRAGDGHGSGREMFYGRVEPWRLLWCNETVGGPRWRSLPPATCPRRDRGPHLMAMVIPVSGRIILREMVGLPQTVTQPSSRLTSV